ncbi:MULTISPECIES: hypothetical protein [Paenibacillus]|uniref:Phage gp6-like head-tail connector protein n=1 Tax=Paenibacillus silagei TaxID=1670801 RepID=A0ABS4NLL6_9BACL|nr:MULTISPECIES: hypothetical protein [Paenibacillus]ETT65807.1 hypothetical protein C173_19051 [Paenibacillus sp. FSL R7-277]MBP2110948.1 hypothetical protein [Paenibacillus silagei]
MNERLAAVILRIDAIATDILVPLRRKIINEAALLQLYEALDETYALMEHERQIDRELAAILFLLYSQLVTQSNYVYDKSLFVPHIGKLQGYIRKIFGGTLQNV